MLVITAIGAVPALANAGEQPVQLSAKPIGQAGQYFDLTLSPGEAMNLKIALGNHGDKHIVVRTYASDAYTIINGGFAAELRDGAVAGTTTWLDYPDEVLTLQPDRAHVCTFSVSVPKGTPPGEYITSLVLENDVPVRGSGSVALDQVVRQGIAVAVRVPGPLTPGLAIGSATHKLVADRSVIAIDVSNTGNNRLTPRARIRLHDSSGDRVSRAAVPMDSFYAGTATKVEVTLAKALSPGSYTVDLTLDDDPRNVHAEELALPVTVPEPTTAADASASVQNQVVDVLQSRQGGFPIWVAGLLVLAVVVAARTLTLLVRRHDGARGARARRGGRQRSFRGSSRPRLPRPAPGSAVQVPRVAGDETPGRHRSSRLPVTPDPATGVPPPA